MNVAAGTYTEQLTIDQSLSLVGAGASSTTIQAPASLSGNEIEIASGATVTISGLTVDGASTSTAIDVNGGNLSASSLAITGYNVGVSVENAGAATITDSTITGATTGILVGSGSSDTSTLTATNDSFAGDTVGVQNNQTSGPLTATMDWWGSSTGPTNSGNPGGTGATGDRQRQLQPLAGRRQHRRARLPRFPEHDRQSVRRDPQQRQHQPERQPGRQSCRVDSGRRHARVRRHRRDRHHQRRVGPGSTDVFTIKDTSVQFNAADGLERQRRSISSAPA